MTARDTYPVFRTHEQTHPERHLAHPLWIPADAAKNETTDSDTARPAPRRRLVDQPDNCQSAFGRMFGSRSIRT